MNKEDVNKIYNEILGRNVDNDGIIAYTNKKNIDKNSLINILKDSEEFKNKPKSLKTLNRSEVNSLYKEILDRNADYTAFDMYIHNPKIDYETLKQILRDSDEYKDKNSLKPNMSHYIPKHINLIKHIPYFEVVISRYNEDISTMFFLQIFNCKVFVYNKGPVIINTPSNFVIINIDNIGFEDYVYMYHIVNNYQLLADSTIFLQCGLDHNIYLPSCLLNTNIWKQKQQSLSCCYPNKTTDISQWNNDIKFDSFDTGVLQSTDTFQSLTDLTAILKNYNIITDIFKLNLSNNFNFSPGAHFLLDKNTIISNNLSYYKNLLEFIEYVHKTDSLKVNSKLLAECFERFYFQIFKV